VCSPVPDLFEAQNELVATLRREPEQIARTTEKVRHARAGGESGSGDKHGHEATVQKFIKSSGYTFPVLLDPDRRVFDHFRVMAIPATKVFNREGLLMAEVENTTEAELRQLIDSAGRKRQSAEVN
jgi:hypothetical protein